MSKIFSFLGVKLSKLTRNTKTHIINSYKISTQNESSRDLIIKYLDKFPLFSSKYLNYIFTSLEKILKF